MRIPQYTGAEAAAEIILSPMLRSESLVFVEGPAEVKLLNGLNPEWCGRVLACNGHAGVRDALTAIERWEEDNDLEIAVIGLIDRDYGKRNRRSRITTSNNRDIEVDMYLTDAGVRFLSEKASSSKCTNHRECIDEAMEQLRGIGILRAISSRDGLCLDFSSIRIDKLCNSDGSVNIEKACLSIAQCNAGSGFGAAELKSMLSGGKSYRTEEVVRGHDVSALLGKWLRKKIGNRKCAETSCECIEEDLRLATTSNHLRSYSWYRRLHQHLTRRPTGRLRRRLA